MSLQKIREDVIYEEKPKPKNLQEIRLKFTGDGDILTDELIDEVLCKKNSKMTDKPKKKTRGRR